MAKVFIVMLVVLSLSGCSLSHNHGDEEELHQNKPSAENLHDLNVV